MKADKEQPALYTQGGKYDPNRPQSCEWVINRRRNVGKRGGKHILFKPPENKGFSNKKGVSGLTLPIHNRRSKP